MNNSGVDPLTVVNTVATQARGGDIVTVTPVPVWLWVILALVVVGLLLVAWLK